MDSSRRRRSAVEKASSESSVDPVGFTVKNEPVCGSRAWMRADWSLSFASRSKLLRVCCALLRVELFAGNSKRSKYHSQPCAQALSKSIPDHFGTDFGVLVVYLNLGQVFQSWLGEISGRFCYLLAGQRQDARPFCLCMCLVLEQIFIPLFEWYCSHCSRGEILE